MGVKNILLRVLTFAVARLYSGKQQRGTPHTQPSKTMYTIHKYELEALNLPTEGLSDNGSILNNRPSLVGYMNGLSDSQKQVFLDLLIKSAFSSGYEDATAEE